MSKRGPGFELNKDNWDEEVEGEDAGTFQAADEDTIQRRQIKKARRKTNPGEQEPNGAAAEGGPAPFKGFTAFAPTTAGTNPLFSFNPGSVYQNFANTSTVNTSSIRHEGATVCNTTGGASSAITSFKAELKDDQSAKYYQHLKALNKSVNKWITEHVEKNPYCILSPIFKDYENHLADLEKRYPNHGKKEISDTIEDDNNETETKDKNVKTNVGTEKSDEVKTSPTVPSSFKFGTAKEPSTSESSSLFKFGAASKPGTTTDSAKGTGLFSGFGSGKTASTQGFSFAVKAPENKDSQEAGSSAQAEEEEYVPPKNEVETVKEDDAYYTKRCKLYYKKGETWADRGVGNLHLKKCDDDSTALLVRADTALGNILLNILVASSMPVNRQGKNNVMLSCIPNPPIDEKKKDDTTPVSMLIRVKTGEDADELFEKIKEAKESKAHS